MTTSHALWTVRCSSVFELRGKELPMRSRNSAWKSSAEALYDCSCVPRSENPPILMNFAYAELTYGTGDDDDDDDKEEEVAEEEELAAGVAGDDTEEETAILDGLCCKHKSSNNSSGMRSASDGCCIMERIASIGNTSANSA
jgi:hypothetical protein